MNLKKNLSNDRMTLGFQTEVETCALDLLVLCSEISIMTIWSFILSGHCCFFIVWETPRW